MKSTKWIHACSSAALCGCFSLYFTKNISFKSSMENKQQTLRFLPHTKTKGIVDVMRENEKARVTGNWTHGTWLVQQVLCHAARTAGQPPSLYMYCKGSTAKVVLKCLNHTVVVAQCQSTGCTGVMGLITGDCQPLHFPFHLTLSSSLSTQQFQIIMQFLKVSSTSELTWSKSLWSVSNEERLKYLGMSPCQL